MLPRTFSYPSFPLFLSLPLCLLSPIDADFVVLLPAQCSISIHTIHPPSPLNTHHPPSISPSLPPSHPPSVLPSSPPLPPRNSTAPDQPMSHLQCLPTQTHARAHKRTHARTHARKLTHTHMHTSTHSSANTRTCTHIL